MLALAVVAVWSAVAAMALGVPVPQPIHDAVAAMRGAYGTLSAAVDERSQPTTVAAPATETPPSSSSAVAEPTETRSRAVHPRIKPTDGPAIQDVKHTFYYAGRQHTVSLRVDRRLYWGARNAQREMTRLPGETEEEFHRAWVQYMVNDPAQKPVIKELSKQLRAISSQLSLDDDQRLELIAKYVQSLPYDDATFATRDFRNRFPVETIVDGTGLCGDTSLLMGVLLAEEGFDIAYLVFEQEEHASLGVRGPGTTYGSTGYLYLETTSPFYVSEIPEGLIGGITLRSEPWIVRIGDGGRQYRSASHVTRIVKARAKVPAEGQRLADRMSSKPWTRPEWDAMEKQLNDAQDAYNKYLQANPSASGPGAHQEFKDRRDAIRWLDQYGWWE